VEEKGDEGVVRLTEAGRTKVLKFSLESLRISRPERWDGRWTLVFYDVVHGKKEVRDRLRRYLLAAGFYPLQESVYLHAYPCAREVDFLRHFLGVAGEVRIIFADKIEDDQVFRDYFGV
jgi:DNA-binding transcriptional regulator PaaX